MFMAKRFYEINQKQLINKHVIFNGAMPTFSIRKCNVSEFLKSSIKILKFKN